MFDPASDISADFVVFKPFVCSAINGPLSGSLMGFMRQVVPSVDWRSVAVKFSGDCSRVPIKGACDLAYFLPFALKN